MVDASLMVAWLLQEDSVRIVPDIYDILPEKELLVPSHWPLEVSNALAVNVKRKRISVELMDKSLDNLSTFQIKIDTTIPVNQIGILAHFAMGHQLTVYDASYVQLALEHSLPLATFDQAMISAARKLNIEIMP